MWWRENIYMKVVIEFPIEQPSPAMGCKNRGLAHSCLLKCSPVSVLRAHIKYKISYNTIENDVYLSVLLCRCPWRENKWDRSDWKYMENRWKWEKLHVRDNIFRPERLLVNAGLTRCLPSHRWMMMSSPAIVCLGEKDLENEVKLWTTQSDGYTCQERTGCSSTDSGRW